KIERAAGGSGSAPLDWAVIQADGGAREKKKGSGREPRALSTAWGSGEVLHGAVAADGGRRGGALVELELVDREVPVRVGAEEADLLDAALDLGAGAAHGRGERDAVLGPLGRQCHELLRVVVAAGRAVAVGGHVGLGHDEVDADLGARGGGL